MSLTLAMLGGCTKVDPGPDFHFAQATIRERLDVDAAYDPEAEDIVRAKVDELLDGGITVNEAVRVALLNNRTLQAIFHDIGASRADVVQSGLLTNPALTLGTRFPEGGGRAELTLGFAQQLVDLWQIPIRRRVAEAELAQTVTRVLHEAVQVATAARNLAYELLWRQQLVHLARENLNVAEQSVDVAEARWKAGDAGLLELGLVRTTVQEAQAALWTAERDEAVARLELARILGLARYLGSWSLSGTLDLGPEAIASEDHLVAQALSQRFDVQAATAQADAAEERLELEVLQVLPSLEFALNAERTERHMQPGRTVLADTARSSLAAGQLTAPAIESRGQRRRARSQFIDALLGPSVQITLPIWDQNQAQIARARYELARANKQEEDALDAAATEVRRAAADARLAQQRVRYFQQVLLPQVEQNLQAARSLYENGAESVVVLLQAQQQAFLQKRAALDAQRDQVLALSELQGAVGGSLPGAVAIGGTAAPGSDQHRNQE